MPTLFWDASALAKRYAPETGSPTALALFSYSPVPKLVTTPWGYTETYALLLRKRNSGVISLSSFVTAASALQNDIILQGQFRLLTVTNADIIGSITHIHKHNLNSTDAALLAALLRYVKITGETCVLVAADARFCRAAQAERLSIINPETMSAADTSSFLSAL